MLIRPHQLLAFNPHTVLYHSYVLYTHTTKMDSTPATPPAKKPLKNPCNLCQSVRAILKRPKTGQQLCKECFFHVFETEIHNTITDNKLFSRGDRVAIGASGGKGN